MTQANTPAPALKEAGRAGGLGAGFWIVAGLVGVELLAISLLYQHGFRFECRARAPAVFCGALSTGVLRAMAAMGAAALILVASPVLRAALTAGSRRRPDAFWLAAQICGFAMILAPRGFLDEASGAATFALAVTLWLGGMALAAGGAALAAFGPAHLGRAARLAGPGGAIAVAVALATPELAAMVQRVWTWSPITHATFHSAQALLEALGQSVHSEPENVLLRVGDFAVLVGRQCSGVEGVALITAFMSFYLYLFRARLRFPLALILLPLGVAASWLLNIVRIAVLVMIGAHVSPELAIEGFHSHAGWLLFTALSMTLIAVAHAAPQLRAQTAPRAGRTPPPPLRADWNAARLLPFVAFMLSALIASTFFATPQQVYPLRFAVTAAVALWFWSHYSALPWRADMSAVMAGGIVGALWIVTSPPPSETDAALAAWLAAAPTWLFAVWIATRALGTAVIVPLIEELVFRSYILERANFGGRAGLVFAVALSTALFAALHDRWIAAALAGLVFAALTLRSGRVTDAIVAHATANALIAAAAAATGDWSKI